MSNEERVIKDISKANNFTYFNDLIRDLECIEQAYSKNQHIHWDYAKSLEDDARRVKDIMEVDRHISEVNKLRTFTDEKK